MLCFDVMAPNVFSGDLETPSFHSLLQLSKSESLGPHPASFVTVPVV